MAGVTVADQNFREKSCSICGLLENLKCCGKCRSIWYCGREHQKQDWRNHKEKCKELQPKTKISDAPKSNESNNIVEHTEHVENESANPTTDTEQEERDREAISKASSSAEKSSTADQKSKSKKSRNRNKKKSKSDNGPSENLNNQGEKRLSASNSLENTLTSSDGKTDAGAATGIAPADADISDNKDSAVKPEPETNYDPRPFRRTEFPVPESKSLDSLAKHIAEYLRRDNRCIVNDLLPINAARAIRVEVEKLHESGSFVDGPLSGGKTSSVNTKKYSEKAIRSDKITWLQGTEENYPNICHYMKHLDIIVQKLNCYLGEPYQISGRTKAMVACYPGNGTGYAYHVDNPNKDGRILTFLFYLNEGWDVEKLGGLLRILPPGGDYVDVDPILNRLLVFWSDRRNPHEVQPAWASRYAITMWYFDKEEREAAKAAQLNEDLRNINNDMLQVDVKAKSAEKASLQQEIRKLSQNLVETLPDEELEALAVLVESSPNPHKMLTSMNIAPQIQDSLMSRLRERKKTMSASASA